MNEVSQSNTEDLSEKLNQIQQNLSGALTRMYAEAETVFQAYTESLKYFEKNLSSEMMKILNKLIPLLEAEQKLGIEFLIQRFGELATEGWFCDIGTTKIECDSFMKNLTFSNDIPNLGEAFQEYYTSHLDLIEQRLISMYPERIRFISEAFSAHRNGKYIFSIPILLSFADGITFLKTGEACLFTSSDKQPKIIKTQFMRDLLENSMFIVSLASAISNFSAINKPEKIDDNKFFLNRHSILHGKNIDYDTELNSLKVISLVNYLACLYMGWLSHD
jgi:hypothetical protein